MPATPFIPFFNDHLLTLWGCTAWGEHAIEAALLCGANSEGIGRVQTLERNVRHQALGAGV
jgi:hypothetical protein